MCINDITKPAWSFLSLTQALYPVQTRHLVSPSLHPCFS